jgi:outer membrane protein assembly factor BamD (BamD/ComL family)
VAIAVLAIVLLAGPAAATPPTPEEKAKAREHYQKGLTHYDIKEYSEALAEFKNAYRVVQDPAFLFNIAQCYRKLGQDVEALDYYRNFVRRFPNAPNRGEVDRRIQEIEKELDNRPAPVSPLIGDPRLDTGPKNGAAQTPPPPAEPPPPPAASPAPAIVATPQPVQSEPPIYTRWWFWTAVGAVVVVAGGVILAVATRGEVGDCRDLVPCRTVGE